MNYSEEDMLMLSGVQHYVFCPRQWALIHIDQQWADNRLTAEGQILHKNVDNPSYRQKNNDKITLRSVHLASQKLGLYGIADAIELEPSDDSQNSIIHPKFEGLFIPYPIEYKRGHHKLNACDTMQLVCQVMCIEEMYNITISKAALFYWEVHRREEVEITEELRSLAVSYVSEMHYIFNSRVLPLAIEDSKCRRCSLKDICMPQLQNRQPVENYLMKNLYEETS